MKTRFNYLLLVLLFVAGVLTSCDTETIDSYLDNYMDDYLEENNEDDEESSVEDEEEGSEDESSEESLNDEDSESGEPEEDNESEDYEDGDIVDKSNYATVATLPGDAVAWSSGYDIPDIFDGTYIDTGTSAYHSSSNAVSTTEPWNSQAITFDLGVTIRLSSFTLWPRGASHRYFTHNMIEYFTLYGAAELTEAMYDYSNISWSMYSGLAIPNFDEWVVLRDGWDHDAYEAAGGDIEAGFIDFSDGGGHCYAPSGISVGETATADDLTWVENNGHRFSVDNDTAVRYIRLQCHSSWSRADLFQLAEVDFYGEILD